MLKTKFSKVFIFSNLVAVVLGSPLVMIAGEMAYEENFLTCIAECIPLYLIVMIIILVFFLYRPKACSLFVLPIAYLLLIPLYVGVLFIFLLPLSNIIGADTWSIFLANRFFNFFALPIVAITSCMALYLNLTESLRLARGDTMPLLLRLRELNIRKKMKIMILSIIVVVVLEYILYAMATM